MARLQFGSAQMLVNLIAPGLTVKPGAEPTPQDYGLGFYIEVEGPDLGPDDDVVAVVHQDTTLEGPVYSFSWKKL